MIVFSLENASTVPVQFKAMTDTANMGQFAFLKLRNNRSENAKGVAFDIFWNALVQNACMHHRNSALSEGNASKIAKIMARGRLLIHGG